LLNCLSKRKEKGVVHLSVLVSGFRPSIHLFGYPCIGVANELISLSTPPNICEGIMKYPTKLGVAREEDGGLVYRLK
jgi:hypothetical protein